ncbi:hypothetical protein FEM48_Zijuj06G0074600 [Ziziphus jujuba var. spinosa]|uniref:Cytochrome P450 n=1 Tax=Ziziphus jujuba var. spinosa TaxID=714518 RepID=A0A978V7Z0_ZIZJJ|nr:hypothetical protein FEM48_Zijuj06G0074600 [Ziziphus jujuba var. spinosa]
MGIYETLDVSNWEMAKECFTTNDRVFANCPKFVAPELTLEVRGALKKAQQELEEHVGRGRQVKESDLNNLVYLQAILKENTVFIPIRTTLASPRVHGRLHRHGRRMCPGVSLALQFMQLTLAALLHGFDMTTPSNEAFDMCEKFGLTSMKASPLDVLLTPGLPANLYY